MDRKFEKKMRIKKTPEEIRNEMGRDLAPIIAGKVLQILHDRIVSNEKILDGEIGDAIRQVVDDKINIDDEIFSKYVFENMGDLYDEVVPLVQTGIQKIKEQKPAA